VTHRTLLLVAALAVGAALATTAAAAPPPITVSPVVAIGGDVLSQNETPIAINSANPSNMITGANDWNYNDGCAVNATKDGGHTWTPTLPNGFLPGITLFTNDPNVAGTGIYDAGGDPTIAFSPNGKIAYYVCQSFDFTSPFDVALLLNRSTDGGVTWQTGGLVQVSTFHGNGVNNGSKGKFPDHENLHVDPVTGYLYLTWAEFSGNQHSPVYVATSHDRGDTWTQSRITYSNVRNNQDQRVVTDGTGNAYLVFDNTAQGSKDTALYASKSTDGGLHWSAPVQFATLTNPVCVFPPYCFNIAGGQFRAGGSYPAPAFDLARNRLDVLISDIRGPYAQMFLYTLKPDLTLESARAIPGGARGDRFMGELSAAPNGRLDASFWDRSYSGNQLVDMTYATSSDGGLTWRQTNVAPLTSGYDPSLWGVPSGNAQGFRPFIGDYNGIASTNAFAAMTWTGVAPPQPLNLEINFATATP
jgi:hypothetical protein